MPAPSVFGVVCALPREVRCLQRAGCLGAATACIKVGSGGVGYAAATAAAKALLDQGVDGLLSFGYAGGLDPGLANGSVVVADRIAAGQGDDAVLDPELVAAIRRRVGCAMLERPVILAHAGKVLSNTAEKIALFRETGAVAVDMESLAVARAARAAGVASASVRVIVDPAGFALPAAAVGALGPDGGLRPWTLLQSLLRRPADVVALWRLRRLSSVADAALQGVARAFAQSNPKGS